MALPVQLSNNQTDPTIAFVENEGQSLETQWAMGNVKPVSKKVKKFRSFLTKTRRKKNWARISQQAAQINGAPSINAKHQHFQASCTVRTQKITL